MGLPLHRPCGSASDPLLDDERLVHESKGLPLHQSNGSAGDPLPAQSVNEHHGLSLLQHPNGSVGDAPIEDGPSSQDSNGSTCDHVRDDTHPEHELGGSLLPRHLDGSISEPVQTNAQLVHVCEGRDPHVVPTFTTESLTKPRSPILYLPPLLSSLPHGLSVPPVSVSRPLLVTETRLPDIDPASLSLHRALHHFGPVSEDYAGLPYMDAFNWSDLELQVDEEREWYAVAFRSRRKKGSDSGPLYDADRLAHEEAVSNGGLLMYWYGVPNPETGMNLATCIWQSRRHAIAANSRPHHIRAMKLAAVSYEIYALERYRLTKVKGENGILVEEFTGDKCGW